MKSFLVRSAAVVASVVLSTSVWAAGHGIVIRPGGAGGVRMGHAVPPVAGTWHVRTGQSFITGRPGFAYGHTATIGRGQFGYGGQRGVFGHTATLPNGFERHRFGARYGVYDRGRVGLGYGRYPQVLGGYGYGAGYGNGAYGGDYGSGGGTGFVPVPFPAGGYGEPSLASRYSEPSLNGGGYGGPYEDGSAAPSIAGTGGPQVIVVNSGGAACNCHGRRPAGPTIYRYGVGTYY